MSERTNTIITTIWAVVMLLGAVALIRMISDDYEIIGWFVLVWFILISIAMSDDQNFNKVDRACAEGSNLLQFVLFVLVIGPSFVTMGIFFWPYFALKKHI